MIPAHAEPRWYEDRAALGFIALRFAPVLGALNLAWEVAQLPLYTLWRDATPAFRAYAVVHCTLGDVLIGTSALAIALLLTRAGGPRGWRWGRDRRADGRDRLRLHHLQRVAQYRRAGRLGLRGGNADGVDRRASDSALALTDFGQFRWPRQSPGP